MKKYLLALALSASLLSVPFSFAQAARAQVPTEITVSSPTSELVDEANRLFSHGKKFHKAIAFYEEAARREPKNAAYQTYVACAKAGRAFAMARYVRDAYLFDSRKTAYTSSAKQWENAQKNKAHPLYGLSLPTAPTLPVWPDGDEEKPATDTAIKVVIGEAAKSAFTDLQKISETVSSQTYAASDKTELLTLQGWSALMLYVGPYRFVDAPEKVKTLALMKATLKPTMDNPKDVRQTQRAADAWVISCSYPVVVPDELFNKDDLVTLKEGIDLAIAAAPKARNQGAMWYWIATNQASREHGEPQDKDAALESYKKAVKCDPANALYRYTLASNLITRQKSIGSMTSDDTAAVEILEEIKNGNACASVGTAEYNIASPSLVRWAFTPYPFSEWYNTTMLSIFLQQLQWQKVKEGKTDAAVALTRESERCGKNYLQAINSPALSDAQKSSYLSAGRRLMVITGDAVVLMKVGGQSVPQDLEYTMSFVPENHRRGLKINP